MSGGWIVVGAAVGALASLAAGWVERASRRRSELVSAAAAWLTATEAFTRAVQVDTLYSTPSSNAVGKGIDWLADLFEETIGKGRAEVARALVHRPLIERVEAVVERVTATTVLLVLQAPRGLLREIEPHLESLNAWTAAPTDAALKAQWEDEARPAVVRALRRATGPTWRRALPSRTS